MALMMKVCGLSERNAGGGNAYRYMTGWLNEQTRVVIMPNRDKSDGDDADWVLYISPVALKQAEPEKDAKPAGDGFRWQKEQL
jgi:hypothetical protein